MFYTRSAGDKIFDFFNYAIMVLLGVLFVYPFWDVFVLSLATVKNADSLGLRLFTWPVSFDTYRGIFQTDIAYIGYYNTIFRTVIGTSLTVLVTYFGAYALAKRDLPLRTFITLFILFTMFFSGGLIPTFLNMRWLGLFNSRWVLILPMLTSAWNLILCRNFIMTLPTELEDAALIDGAHPITMIFYIMLPLSTPILAVLALWTSISHWNAWFDCMLYINDRSKYVLQIMLQRILMSQQGALDYDNIVGEDRAVLATRPTLRAAMTMVTIGPIILMYPFLQKYFVKGIFIGSLKG